MSRMKIQASRRMAEWLRENLNLACVEHVDLVKMTHAAYRMSAAGGLFADEFEDMDANGNYPAVRIDYRPNCYCSPTWLPTSWFSDVARRAAGTGVLTAEKLLAAIRAEVEV